VHDHHNFYTLNYIIMCTAASIFIEGCALLHQTNKPTFTSKSWNHSSLFPDVFEDKMRLFIKPCVSGFVSWKRRSSLNTVNEAPGLSGQKFTNTSAKFQYFVHNFEKILTVVNFVTKQGKTFCKPLFRRPFFA